jgi:hypothetical protein
MKTLLIFALTQLLIFVAPFSQLLAAEPAPAVTDSTHITAQQGFADGDAAAGDHYGSGKWLGYGLCGGFLLGLIGAGVIVGISQSGRPEPPPKDAQHIANGTAKYQLGFGDAYAKRAKKKSLGMAIVGGLVGTAVAIAVIAGSQK